MAQNTTSPSCRLSTRNCSNQAALFSCITRFTLFPAWVINKQSVAIVGVLQDDVDPLVSVMKLEKAPTETYADIGGLESQIQEIKVISRR